MQELMGGGDLNLDLKLGSLDRQDDAATRRKSSSSSGGKSEETVVDRHKKRLSKSRSKSSRSNVMISSDRKRGAGENEDERESLKLLLASLDAGSLSIVVDTPPPPLRVPSSLTTTPTKTRPKSGGTDKRRSKERGSAIASGTAERPAEPLALLDVISSNSNNNEKEREKQRALDDRLKVLEEREKKLIEWEEQLFKEEMERDKAAEAALAERERAMEQALAQREIELEQRIGKKLEEQMNQALEARTRSLADWEDRLRTQESSFRSREVPLDTRSTQCPPLARALLVQDANAGRTATGRSARHPESRALRRADADQARPRNPHAELRAAGNGQAASPARSCGDLPRLTCSGPSSARELIV
jgi:hypothetical protein